MIKTLYLELANIITDNLPNNRWVDLWHNQVSFLEDEHPFPTPAIFIAISTGVDEDLGLNLQNQKGQIDFYLFFETFLDTFDGAYNQNGAFDFLAAIDELMKLFHASSGVSFSSMAHVFTGPVDTGSAGNLYKISFDCLIHNTEAEDLSAETGVEQIGIEEGVKPKNTDDPYFLID